MLNDLQHALAHLQTARTLVHSHLSEYLYPHIFEDLDYDIQTLKVIISALTKGEPIPGTRQRRPHKRRQPSPGAADR